MIKKTKQIERILKTRNLENLPALNAMESILKKERDFVFKMPKPNTPVIVLLSGGADSVTLAFMLLEKYKLHLYPLFLNRSQQRAQKEKAAAQFYVKQMKEKYKGLCEDLFVMDSPIPPNKIRHQITLHSDEVKYTNSQQLKGIPVYLMSLTANAVQFAHFLEITKKVHTRTIFCGFVASDGEYMAYETLTALRSANLSTCLMENDFSWQITSLALEKEIGNFLSKHEVFKWATEAKISLSHTWSCYYPFKYHCGACIGCWARMEHSQLTGFKDDIIYRAPSRLEMLQYRIKRKIYAEYRKFHF